MQLRACAPFWGKLRGISLPHLETRLWEGACHLEKSKVDTTRTMLSMNGHKIFTARTWKAIGLSTINYRLSTIDRCVLAGLLGLHVERHNELQTYSSQVFPPRHGRLTPSGRVRSPIQRLGWQFNRDSYRTGFDANEIPRQWYHVTKSTGRTFRSIASSRTIQS